MSKKIAVIDNYDSFVYNIIRYLKEVQEGEVIVMRNDQIDFEELENCDSILLSPGPGIPSEAGELLEVIERFGETKKMLGVCLGHQALGEFFGSKLEQCKTPVHGRSSIIQHFENDKLFDSIQSDFEVGRYHSWILKNESNSSLEITALSKDNEIMAFKHKIYNIRGVQFHPESILTPDGRKIIENWVKL